MRSFRVLAYLSLVGQAVMFVGLAIIMGFALDSTITNQPAIRAINWGGIPVFFGMVRVKCSYPVVVVTG